MSEGARAFHDALDEIPEDLPAVSASGSHCVPT